MGLNVLPDGRVEITDQHEQLLATRHPGQCYTAPRGGIVVVGVFRRNKQGDGRDGMPLTDALKGRGKASIDSASLAILRERATDRVRAFFRSRAVDVVVPAPSSSGVPLCLARELVRVLGGAARIEDLLRKPTVGAVLRNATDEQKVKNSDRRLYREAVRKLAFAPQHHPVAVKAIHRRVREYFILVETKPDACLTPGLNLIVVDDSSSSGATLGDSVRALYQAFQPASVTAVALVGP